MPLVTPNARGSASNDFTSGHTNTRAPQELEDPSWVFQDGPLEIATRDDHNYSAHPSRYETETHLRTPIAGMGPLQNKQRIQCFEHGCDGRAFSCPENYKRHLREQSRIGATNCELCGKSFSRKSNCEQHLSKGRCRAFKELLSEAYSSTCGSDGVLGLHFSDDLQLAAERETR